MSNSPRHAVAADTVFDGAVTLHNHAVVIEGSRIKAVVPHAELPAGIATHSLPAGFWLAPGFVDVQVNGGGDVLFNDHPTPEGLRMIAAAHRRFGTTSLLPTIISTSDAVMEKAHHAVISEMQQTPGIVGIHFEGPFLSPEKNGIHDRRMFRAATPWHKDLLMQPSRGVTLLTCAPECVPGNFIRDLTSAGVRVSLGHSMAGYEETHAAIKEGLTGFTHLFNAMQPLASRAPGPVAAALESPGCWYGLIADGVHVAPAMLRLAMRGLGHPMLVTDAMPPVGGSKSSFDLDGKTIMAEAGRCAAEDGVLAGSTLDMASAVRNCVHLAGMPLANALRFASLEPARFLGLEAILGRLAPDCRADMVALDAGNIRVQGTWVAGAFSSSC